MAGVKTRAPAILLALALCGCSSLPKLVRELKDDPATVDAEIMSPFVSMRLHRAWPEGMTNRVAETPRSRR